MKTSEYLQCHINTAIFSLIVGYQLSPLLFGIVVEVPESIIKKTNENTKTGRGEVKLSLCVVDTIIYVENSIQKIYK